MGLVATVLISSTESEASRALGTSSQFPESYGVDFFWCARGLTWGVQRKALQDFCASVDDGRLAMERLQMRGLDHAFLVLETGERGGGQPREMPNLTLVATTSFGRAWTGPQLRGVLYGLAADGVQVVCVRDEEETIARVVELADWSKKERHDAARGRGSAPRSVFGDRGNREYGMWMLRGLPGVGAKAAGAIWDHFGGLPIELRDGVGVKELMKVEGVGKVTAQKIVDVFAQGDGEVVG